MQLTICHDMESLQENLASLALEGQRIALVPTMGALHEGHLALVRQAQDLADAVVVSIFVNPKQFGPKEDFGKYPRTLEADVEKLNKEGVQLVYAPDVADLYPEGFSTSVSVGELGTILCGKFRPGHFDGVATVVAKLLLRMLPHVAVFGEKDFQQLCVINRMVSDLDIAVEIVGVETMREPDGLALSSRNAYLSAEERKTAPALYKTLQACAAHIEAGQPPQNVLAQGIAELTKLGFTVDYLELRHGYSLAEMKEYAAPARLLAAAWLGKTRLIDNLAME